MNSIRKTMMNTKPVIAILIALTLGLSQALLTKTAVASSPASPVAQDRLGQPLATPLGTFGGIAYTQYDGIFEGQTSTGAYRVPYRITAPTDPIRANRTVLVEPPHPCGGLGTLNTFLRQDFLFPRGFAHAGIGWSTSSWKDCPLRILDPATPGVFIDGGFHEHNGRTDDEIITDFARALRVDPVAGKILGRVDRRYLTGYSDSSDPVLRLVMSGGANGVFDFVLPFMVVGYDPQAALADGRFGGKLIILNNQAPKSSLSFVDRGNAPNLYRFYAVAGTPHIPDALVPDVLNPSGSTPASWQPDLRAHFLQGDAWVRGAPPPPSNHLLTTSDGTLVLDANGNAISVDASGQPVPRLPIVELGEAHFTAGFIGTYDTVKTIADLGFASHDAYLKAFQDKLSAYLKAGYILKEDADAMLRRAALCPPLTYTETYRDHYDNFTTITSLRSSPAAVDAQVRAVHLVWHSVQHGRSADTTRAAGVSTVAT